MVSNVADLLRASAAARPEHPALVDGARRTTYAQLDAAVDACAAGLAARGLLPAERVALLLGNTTEFVVAYLGALRAGLVAAPLHPGSTAHEVARALSDVGPRLLLCEPATAAAAAEAAAAVDELASTGVATDSPAPEVLDVSTPAWDGLLAAGRAAGAGAGAGAQAPGGDALAVLLLTAGTGGRPKAAMLRHAALLANVAQLRALSGPPAVRADDVLLAVLPLFHVFGLNAVLGAGVAAGATVVLADRFSPEATAALVAAEGVTNVAGAPAMYAAWVDLPGLREAFAGVRLLVSGAAPLPPEVFAAVRAATGLPVWEGYGLTECAPVVTTCLVGGAPKPGSVGRPLPGVRLRLVEGGQEVDDGDPGEVEVSSPALFSGYWPDGSGGPGPDGWYATGDVGVLDADGDLRLVDRRRELVLVNGFNVYPREVEAVVEQLAGVAECAVVGVPHARTGEAVVAYVVVAAGHALTVDEVRAHCAARLARFKRPERITLVGVLPHSVTGKVAKGLLRRDARA